MLRFIKIICSVLFHGENSSSDDWVTMRDWKFFVTNRNSSTKLNRLFELSSSIRFEVSWLCLSRNVEFIEPPLYRECFSVTRQVEQSRLHLMISLSFIALCLLFDIARSMLGKKNNRTSVVKSGRLSSLSNYRADSTCYNLQNNFHTFRFSFVFWPKKRGESFRSNILFYFISRIIRIKIVQSQLSGVQSWARVKEERNGKYNSHVCNVFIMNKKNSLPLFLRSGFLNLWSQVRNPFRSSIIKIICHTQSHRLFLNGWSDLCPNFQFLYLSKLSSWLETRENLSACDIVVRK